MGIMDNAGGSAVKFNAAGDSVTGRVLGIEEYDAAYDGKPKLTAAGKQIRGYRIDLACDDGEARSVWAEAWRQVSAIQAAVIASGALDIVPGGTLTLTFTHTEQGKGASPAKCYSATYAPPGSGLMTAAAKADAPVSTQEALAAPIRPGHIPESLWDALSVDQRKAVVGAAPF